MLTPLLRVSLLMDLVMSALRDQALELGADAIKAHLASDAVASSYFEKDRHLDAAWTLRLIKLRAETAGHGDRRWRKSVVEACDELIQLRNIWAHQRPIDEAGSIAAVHLARTLFKEHGLRTAEGNADSLIVRVTDNDLRALRKRLLEAICKERRYEGSLVTYGDVAADLGWRNGDRPTDRLTRALNGLGGWQRAVGEPVLSALVVLGPEDRLSEHDHVGLPGHGFYWLVGLPPDADRSRKEVRHRLEVDRIHDYDWRA